MKTSILVVDIGTEFIDEAMSKWKAHGYSSVLVYQIEEGSPIHKKALSSIYS